MVCDWIDEHFNWEISIRPGFPHGFKKQICYIYRYNIITEYFYAIVPTSYLIVRYVVLGNTFAVAHERCIFYKHIGFTGFFDEQDYQHIIQQYIQLEIATYVKEQN